MKFRLLIICLLLWLGFESPIHGQIINTDVLFFVNENSQLKYPGESVLILKFTNGTLCYIGNNTLSKVSENLKKDQKFYDKQKFSKFFNIDSSHFNNNVSTAKWSVYSEISPGWNGFFGVDGYVEGVPGGTRFWAFTKDLSNIKLGENRIHSRKEEKFIDKSPKNKLRI